MKNKIFLVIMLFPFFLVTSCKENKSSNANQKFEYSEEFEKKLQEQLILVEDGGTVEIPAGNYLFKKALSVEGKNNITIKGAGKDKTILSFLGQTDGAEGLNVSNCNNIVIEDFTIQDAKGDNLKIKGCDGVKVLKMNSTWTTGADTSNGNYGYYPVECKNVLIEDCEVSYCADAGVYVGQSTNVIVRKCYAHHNVAGIEIENCINSDIYQNKAENNSGGILVFDLPKLFQANGRNARVWDNDCINNNFKNFAKPGSIVAMIPPGSGMIIMATDSVDIFNNRFTDNKTIGIGIVSYFITGKPVNDTAYGPYCHTIYIHDNIFKRKVMIPDLTSELGKLITGGFKSSMDIIVDGSADPKIRDANGQVPADKKICIQNNGDIKFGNVNFWQVKDQKDVFNHLDRDISKFDCTHTKIMGNNTKID
ncbi:MAG: right-handed parallel beta-helix repeat-containing protein [Bacteroidetes bacterium]|nr:right-handed parallel beta-helix repeat-containing protein [Bacteroidota bacterium]MBL0287004.1 right-handed parallel beta-helix repeat-containing protein [Bacteroidota bacterium]